MRHNYKRQPEEVDDILRGFLRRLEEGGVKKGNAVREAWEKAVGEKTAAHAHPVSFKKGQLMVIVENSAWLYKLTMEKRAIIKEFRENYTGRQTLEEIRFRVGMTE